MTHDPRNHDPRPVVALTIAGSDSGGGAGIQADLKTFAAHDVHGLCAIAALTAQHTRGVTAVHVPPLDFLRAQIDACFDDFRIGAVKIGMLANAEVVHAVADALQAWKPPAIVLDPVMVSSSGDSLLQTDAMAALKSRLIPMASLITPNITEAELLLGHEITTQDAAEAALTELLKLGAKAVLLKGGHLPTAEDEVIDRYDDGSTMAEFIQDWLAIEGHGTGCTLSAAITAQLCKGLSLPEACDAAADYVHGALAGAYRPGDSTVAVLDHFWKTR